jgi:glycosyltransferase involved in cell wall biosynthesis
VTQPVISIVLPVYNEAGYVDSVVGSYRESLKKLPHSFEIILVPNGCRDNSAEVCRALAERDACVRVVESEQGGWGRAVKLGLREARGQILCYTNLARTSPQDLVLHLLYAVAHPQVVIKANRKIRDNWRRRLGGLLYNLECRTLFDLTCWDVNGTPKVFPRDFDKLLGLTRDDDLIDAEFNLICRREGYPLLEVPTFARGRHGGGKSTTNYSSAVRMYLGAYNLWRERKTSKER